LERELKIANVKKHKITIGAGAVGHRPKTSRATPVTAKGTMSMFLRPTRLTNSAPTAEPINKTRYIMISPQLASIFRFNPSSTRGRNVYSAKNGVTCAIQNRLGNKDLRRPIAD